MYYLNKIETKIKKKEKMINLLLILMTINVGVKVAHSVSDKEIKERLKFSFGSSNEILGNGIGVFYSDYRHTYIPSKGNEKKDDDDAKWFRVRVDDETTLDMKVVTNPMIYEGKPEYNEKLRRYESLLRASFVEGSIILKPLGAMRIMKDSYIGFIYERTIGDLADTDFIRLPLNKQVKLMEEAVADIYNLHQQGFVHGELIPSNVKITSSGKIVLSGAETLEEGSVDQQQKEFDNFIETCIRTTRSEDLRSALDNVFDFESGSFGSFGSFGYHKVLESLKKLGEKLELDDLEKRLSNDKKGHGGVQEGGEALMMDHSMRDPKMENERLEKETPNTKTKMERTLKEPEEDGGTENSGHGDGGDEKEDSFFPIYREKGVGRDVGE